MQITCIALAVVIWPIAALADDPNTEVTSGIPIVDAILKILGAVYLILSTLLLMLPKTSQFAQVLGKLVADLKGVVPHAAAVKEATTGDMAAQIKRESTIPPPRGFVNVSILFGVSLLALAVLAFGLWATGCKTNAAKTACDIVHIVDDGCQTFVQVPLPDGSIENVPRSEIVKLAKASKAMRLQQGAP